MDHPKLAAFTRTLEALFHEVDDVLEDRWGQSFSLHPNRPDRGATCNPEMDGLFEIAPDFTIGIGSEKGRGYIISLRVATLDKVPPDQFEAFMTESAPPVNSILFTSPRRGFSLRSIFAPNIPARTISDQSFNFP
ncbi:hypothetical protein FACS189442_4090 [Spirochaetia bacterium]|nr:hypothetical protein FACS189442_4090 [Spirochaetia bacterium]